jgi:hypothetical protein
MGRIMIRKILILRSEIQPGRGIARVEVVTGEEKERSTKEMVKGMGNQTLILKMAWYGTTMVQILSITMTPVESN